MQAQENPSVSASNTASGQSASARDQDPCETFLQTANQLIAEQRFREQAIDVMQDIRGRARARNGHRVYIPDRKSGIDAAAFNSAQQHVDGVETFTLVRVEDLVPRHDWMSRNQWLRAFRRHLDVMTGQDNPDRPRPPLTYLFGGTMVPLRHYEKFRLAAYALLADVLPHQPQLIGLTELLATLGVIAAANYQDAFCRAAAYISMAACTPPIIVAAEGSDKPFHLIHLCR